ncbi:MULTISPECIES: flagellar export protein FliJ [Virgibacillus]|uniref:Flagellar FliJ protein n=1 Tax=Virgibacillus massiliensis TaxID=1462526 RepID=A0A024QCA0_9BACI|nr:MULTISPECIES: flagellar export protein FliJ [Virgibacillus]EQB36416.1 hypothetical protein M948_15405 [Virgibacillus sp. CM-4]MYL42249.1 flagellar export protein FliJ [Virgibacillus massiliensis]CDQ40114.1 Chemotaxis CheF protein [Virgibacillus massiliensis]
MAETVVLNKLLHVREREKIAAQKVYQQSIDFFEAIGTQLYELLKKKEAAEASYEASLSDMTTLEKLREQVRYIEELNHHIVRLQEEVNQARNNMESKQEQLTNAHIEMKKFEKLIETREKNEIEIQQRKEKASMDELSIYQFLNHKNR